MRFIIAGLFLLLLPTLVLAEPTGEVESIGFDGSYRPNCWTPMVVRLKPDSTESGNYVIAVRAQVWPYLPMTPDNKRLIRRDAALLLDSVQTTGHGPGAIAALLDVFSATAY